MRLSRALACLVLSLLLASPVAHADKDKAKELFKKGMTAYKLDHYDEAVQAFEDAYKEQPDAVFLFNIAQAHRLAKRPRPALEFYKKYLKDLPEAKNRAQVEEQIAGLNVELKKLDEEEAAKKKGDEEAAKAAQLRQQEEAQRAIAQTPPPVEEKAKAKRWPMWLGIGLGAAVVVAGGVTAGVLLANQGPTSLGLENAR